MTAVNADVLPDLSEAIPMSGTQCVPNLQMNSYTRPVGALEGISLLADYVVQRD